MPAVRAFDTNGRCIQDIDRTRKSTEEIVSIEIENKSSLFSASHDSTILDYSTLSRILSQNSKRLQQIYISNEVVLSAEYLSFFVSTFQKTDCLRLRDSLHDAAEFGCLVAGLTQPDGLRELQMSFFTPNNRNLSSHLLLLSRGIAFSSSLEKLHLLFRYRLDGLRSALIDAIMMNGSLKSLSLDLSWYADDGTLLPEVFQAAAWNKRIQDLTLRVSFGYESTLLKEEVWIPTLSHPSCTIEKLRLVGISLDAASLEVKGQNTSVKELSIQSAGLTCSDVNNILRHFKSLVSVDLDFNHLRDISLFDYYLLGENPTLESLSLECNTIREEDMTTFLTNLPKLKSLRNLQLNGNLFLQSKPFLTAFENAVCSNAECLERVQYFPRGYGEKNIAKGSVMNVLPCQLRTNTAMEKNTDSYSGQEQRLMVQLSLNRFGQRHFLGGSSNPLPSNLWPTVLQRASNLRYYSPRDAWKQPSLESTRVDVVYWLLKENVFV